MNKQQYIACAGILKEASGGSPNPTAKDIAPLNNPSKADINRAVLAKYDECIAQGMPTDQAKVMASKFRDQYTLSGMNYNRAQKGEALGTSTELDRQRNPDKYKKKEEGSETADSFLKTFGNRAMENPLLFSGAPTLGAFLGTKYMKNNPLLGGIGGALAGGGAAYLIDDMLRKPAPAVPVDPDLNKAPASTEGSSIEWLGKMFGQIKNKFGKGMDSAPPPPPPPPAAKI